MHVCTPSGTDPEGNGCTWQNCGLNATTPDSYFGGCSAANNATAGALCVLPRPVGIAPITGYVGATFSGAQGTQTINVPNVSVWARNVRTGALTGPVTTNPQGYFRTPNLPGDATYQICVTGAGYVSTCDSQSVNILPGATGGALNHTVAITPTPNAVWGTVRLQDSTPCFWFQPAFSSAAVTAQVTLVDSGNNVVAGPVSGNSLGQYVLPVSVTGPYSVHATCELASGSASVTVPSSALQQDIVVANSGPQITSFDLWNGGVGVRRADPGTVLTATVTATDPNGDPLHYAWADDSGRALGLPDAPSVSWPLLSTGGGFQNLRVRVSDAKGGYASAQRSLIVGPNSLLFTGNVVDGTSNAPVANATVTLTGGSNPVTTDANGLFQISAPDAPRFVLNVNKTGYALTSWILYGRGVNLKIPLHRAMTAPLNASTGGTTAFVDQSGLPSPMTATFPPNALVDQNNMPYTGTATIEGFQYDLNQPNPIPGDQGATFNGTTVRLTTFGAFHITPRDTMDNPLRMASGGSVSVTIAVDPSVQSKAPATIPLWIYDQPSGMWQSHSTMTLNASGTKYTGNITHFSEYNADTIQDGGPSSCVKVILDSSTGNPFPTPVLLEAAYTDPGSGLFYHQDVLVEGPTIGIERLAPNVSFTLTIKDPTSKATLKQATFNSGPPLDQKAFPSGFTGDPNFTACNGPYTIYSSALPTGPTYLMSIYGGSMQDNSTPYYQQTNVTGGDFSRSTLTGWLSKNGFPDPNDAHAIYFNNGDLKFGREMHCHNFGGRTSCYVNNYGHVGADDSLTALGDARSLQSAQKLQATVCMEYDPNPPVQVANANVQFYAYAGADGKPFTLNPPSNPVGGPALDGQGAKPMPDMCLACHGGSYDSSSHLVTGASFLPFDLDSFLYDAAGDPHVGLGMDTQTVQEQFRLLNATVLATNNSNQPIKDLMQLWYGGNANWMNQPGTLFQLGGSDLQPGTSGSNLNGGWNATNTVLYDNVVRPACRTCHIARANAFGPNMGDPWATFSQMSMDVTSIQGRACGSGSLATDVPPSFAMPHAEVPFKYFWLFNLGATLATQLSWSPQPSTCPNP
jgi:hypothetical protein